MVGLCFSAQVLGCYGSLSNLTQSFKLINAVLAAASTFFAVTLFYICSASQKKSCAKGSGKEVKIEEFMYRDKTNVEPEMYDYTSNNWSQCNSNEKLKEKFGSCTTKTFDRFTKKDSCTWKITLIRKVLQCET
jgi:hypothetical protein